MATISLILQAFKTKLRSREEIMDFRVAYGDVDRFSESTIEVNRGEDIVIAAERFILLTCTEAIPMQLTTYTMVSGSWVANDPIDVRMQGVFSWPGKISIYIENPSNNVSDLPYRFSTVHS